MIYQLTSSGGKRYSRTRGLSGDIVNDSLHLSYKLKPLKDTELIDRTLIYEYIGFLNNYYIMTANFRTKYVAKLFIV